MIYITACIVLYLFFVPAMLPSTFSNIIDNEQYINDYIISSTLACVAMVECICLLIDEFDTNDRNFDHRKCEYVSNLFSEFGPYYTRRLYQMTEV